MATLYKKDLNYRKMKGRFCEAVVEHILVKKNYKIIKKNYNCIAGEVDIIISKGLFIIFVEVKSWDTYADDALALVISQAKLDRLKSCATYYINDIEACEETHTWKYVRFDVVLVKILCHAMVHYKGV